MAIIRKFQITRYKEIQYNTPTGTVQDGQFGTFSLDDPNVFDSGTIDFVGVMKNVVLIGDLLRITLDTGNVSIQQFNTLTYNQVQQNIANGIFTVDQENIGWVVLGEARKSFYYVDCSISGNTNDGKRPSVEYYYDLSDLGLNGEIVSGDENAATTGFLTGGPPSPALEVIGTFNSGETFFNWGTTPYPNQQDVSLTDYIRFATTGGLIQAPPGSPNTITAINSNRRFNIQLLQSSVEEHRDNLTATPDSSGKYGRQRNPIQEGFAAFVSSQGNCIFTGITGTGTGGPIVVVPEVGTGSDVTDLDTLLLDNYPIITRCPEPEVINFPPHNRITDSEVKNYLNNIFSSSSEITDPVSSRYLEQYSDMSNPDRQMDLLRKSHQLSKNTSGVRDPREFISDTSQIPAGLVHFLKNEKTCTYDVFPATRDKDGDIPEPIGPLLAYYFYNTRESMVNRFGLTESPLKYLGIGSDGYARFSDGNSYTELLGEAVFGCGDPFSFGLDIPEVVVEIDKKNNEFTQKKGPSGVSVGSLRLFNNLHMKGLYFTNTITQYLTDMSYGIPTLTRLTEEEISEMSKTIPTEFAKRWEETVHPVYDLVWNTDTNINYDEVDSALSIHISEPEIETLRSGRKQESEITWDWFLSRGVGHFQIGITGTFGTGPTDPTRITGVNIDVIGIAQSLAALTVLVIEFFDDLFGGEKDTFVKETPVSIEEKRSSFAPRKLHKRGNLVLLSKEGLYSTQYKPCEQIFLGFSDNYYDISPASRRSNIENLSKIDKLGYLPVQSETRQSTPLLQSNENIGSPIISNTDFVQNSISLLSNSIQSSTITTIEEDLFDSKSNESIPGRKCKSVVRRLANIREEPLGEISSNFIPSEFNGSPITIYGSRLVADIEECCGEYYDPLFQADGQINVTEFRTIAKNVVIAKSQSSAWYKQCQPFGEFQPYFESFYKVSDIGVGGNGLKNLETNWSYDSKSGIQNVYWGEECDIQTSFDSFIEYRDYIYRAILPDESGQFDYGRGDDLFRYRLKYDVYYPGNVQSFDSFGEKTTQEYDQYNASKNGLVETLSDDNKVVVIMSRVRGYDPCSKSINFDRETIPALFPRIKKYGRNPLLDVFYLNVVTPGIQYGGDGTSSNRYSNSRRFSHPSRLPFRRSQNDRENSWSDLKYGQFPSMFPQNWNSIKLSSDYNEINGAFSDLSLEPEALTNETSGETYGDRFWKNKVKNTILDAKDRWELSIAYYDDDLNKPYAVLRDKTPILDLYFGLMELHVKGVSWKEILQYVDFAISCVSGNKYSERIDIERLDRLWKIVQNRLIDINSSLLSSQWPHQQDIFNTFFVGSHDFGEVLMIEKNRNLEEITQTNLSEIYGGSIIIQNRGSSIATIESITIDRVSTVNDDVDIYGRTPLDYFFIDDPKTNLWNGTNPPRVIPPSSQNSNLSVYEIPIWFIPQMAQDNFEYSAIVNVVIRVDGQSFTLSGFVTGKTISINTSDSDDDSVNNPLFISEEDTVFQYSNTDTRLNDNIQSLIYYNQSPYDKITIKSFEFTNIAAYNADGSPFEIGQESPFKFLDDRGNSVSGNLFETKKELRVNRDILAPEIFAQEVSFVPTTTEKVYFANVVITYYLEDRANTTNNVNDEITPEEPTDTSITGRRGTTNREGTINTIEFTKTIRLIGISL